MTTAKCRQCSAEASLSCLDPVAGEDGGVRVRVEGLPALVCPSGHRRFVTPEFPVSMIDAVLAADTVFAAPQAERKGLFRKRLHCPECGTQLEAEPRARSEATVTVEAAGAEPFEVVVELPLHGCPDCDRDATPPRAALREPLMKAAANVFRAAEIPPG